MQLFAILTTLRRHRTAAALIVFEIALSCAIVCNALFLIGDRLSRMDTPTGIAEDELVRVQLAGIGRKVDTAAVTAQDLAALRAIPGVTSVATVNMLPLSGGSWDTDLSTIPEDEHREVQSAMYMGGPGVLATLGVHIVAGRDFLPDEYGDFHALGTAQARMPSILLSRALAERMFPGRSALGQAVYVFKDPQTVVGVFDFLGHPDPIQHGERLAYSLLLPANLTYNDGGMYVLRVDPARRDDILAGLDATLNRIEASRVIVHRDAFADVRRAYFRDDRTTCLVGFGVAIALLIITALGVVGLTSFWVQQRTHQIGIRRALGATRGDILRYFQLENFILVTMGTIIGMVLAYGINLWLMRTYHVTRLPATFLPIGALLLWALGQIAVLGPAVRASLVSPAIATRSV